MSTRHILLIGGMLCLVCLFSNTARAEELFSNIKPQDGATIKDPLTPISIEINTAVKADSIKLRINEKNYQLSDKELSWTPPRLVFTPRQSWSYGSYSVYLSFETTNSYVTEKACHFYSGSFFVDNQSALNKSSFSPSGTRLEKNLTSVWKMSKLKASVEKPNIKEDEGYKNRYWESGYDTSSWDDRVVSLSWLVDYHQNSGYGLAWYKKKVFIPKEYEGKKVILTFEGVANQAHLWINGQSAGFREKVITQYLPSRFEITKLVRCGEENDITVGCISSLSDEPWPGGLSGIFGEVKLEFLPKIYVKQVYIDPSLADSSVKVRYEIENSESIGTKIDLSGIIEPTDADAEKKVVSRGEKKDIFLEPGINNVELNIKIDNPEYWSPEEPYLYRLFSLVKEKGEVADVTKDDFGFREFKVKGKYLYLNNNRFFIFGVYRSGYSWKNSVVRWGRLGLEPLEEARRTEEDFREGLKNRGVNFIRMWITPGRYVYDVTDRLGIISYECFECDLMTKKSTEYLDTCVGEIREWIKENYNHPSFVMLNFGNENWTNTEQPNYLYQRLKPEFKDRMIMCASSGMFGFPGQVKERPATDIIDIHSYAGNSFGVMGGSQQVPWTYMEDTLLETYEGYRKKVFGGEIDIPVIVTEAPCQVWFTYWLGDMKRFLHEGKVTPESYLEIAKTPEGGFPIGWDLENASLRNRLGLIEEDMSEKVLKRAIESQRRLDILQGFGANTWGHPIFSLLYRPLFICSGVFDTNLFSGDKLNMQLYLLNHSPEKRTGLQVRVVVRDKANNIINEDKFNVADIPGASRKIVDYAWKIPDTIKTALYDVKLYLYSNNTLASENYYEIYLLNKSDLRDSMVTTGKTAVLLLPQDQAGIQAVTAILDSLKVPYDNLNIEKDLDAFYQKLKAHDILIVPPFYNDRINNWLELNPQMEVVGKSIRRWVEEGGRVISLEQSIKGSLPWVREWRIMDGGKNCYIDMAVPEHPVYHNLVQHNFDTWNGKGGENTRYLITPLSENLIATVSANSNDAMTMAVAEAKVNKGSILASQIAATERYLKDSAATVYIQNLLAYVLEGKELFPGVRESKTQAEGNYFIDLSKCFYVNLKPYVNMGFMDEVAEDEKGGWSDQGENDLRHIPVGEDNPEKKYWQTVYHQELKDKQIFLGVPFEVIDPAKNVNKSCIVLSGGPRPYFPKEVKDIKIGKKAAKLYFLHSAVWCPDSGEVADYNIYYADGTKETIVLNGGKQIADWWGPKDLPEAKVAWSGKHPTTNQTVGVYLFAWTNPHPEKVIATIDFVSTQAAIPILLAITGEE